MEGLKIHNIYVITNKITNKKYVGETSLDIQERFKSHKKVLNIDKNMNYTKI